MREYHTTRHLSRAKKDTGTFPTILENPLPLVERTQSKIVPPGMGSIASSAHFPGFG